jgi:hypothetical protein
MNNTLRFSVWFKDSAEPYSHNCSVIDAIETVKSNGGNPLDFVIREIGSRRRWDGNGKPIPA